MHSTLSYNKIVESVFGHDPEGITWDDFTDQKFLVERIDSLIPENEIDYQFLIEAIKCLTKLTIHDTRMSALNSNTIKMTNYLIHESENTSEYRIKLINTISKHYLSSKESHKKEWFLKSLLDIPREIFRAESDSKQINVYCGDREIELTLEQLDLIVAQTIPIHFKETILDTIKWYPKWGMKDKFNSKLKQVSEKVKPQSLSEILANLYTEEDYDKFSEFELKVVERCNKLVKEHSVDEISIALFEIANEYRGTERRSPNTSPFIIALRSELSKLKLVIDNIWGKNHELALEYFNHEFKVLYFIENEQEYIHQIMVKLKIIGNDVYNRFILNLFSTNLTIANKGAILDQDIDKLTECINLENKNSYYIYSYVLPVLLFFDHQKALKYISLFIEKCKFRESDMLLIKLEDEIFNDYLTGIVEIIEKETVSKNIDYHYKPYIAKILELDNGLQRLFNYFLNRYLYQKSLREESDHKHDEYRLLPFDFSIRNKISDETCFTLYKRFIDWYLENEQKGSNLFDFENILKAFTSSNKITSEYSGYYNNLINVHQRNAEKLYIIASMLSMFKLKNDLLFNLVVKIHEAISDLNREEIIRNRSACYWAIVIVGMKQGTTGVPFQVDLDLKETIEKYLEANDGLSKESRNLFNDALTSINGNIERNTETGEVW